jgi:hypothetical protein
MKKFHIILLFTIGTGICAEVEVEDLNLQAAAEHAKTDFLQAHSKWHPCAIEVDFEKSEQISS